MAKPILKYVDLYNGYCGIVTGRDRDIIYYHGWANVKHIRYATAEDVAHVKAMDGYIPDGRINKVKPPTLTMKMGESE